jgi:hypothetical protein
MYRDGKVPKKARQQSRKQDNTMIQNVGRVNTLEKVRVTSKLPATGSLRKQMSGKDTIE